MGWSPPSLGTPPYLTRRAARVQLRVGTLEDKGSKPLFGSLEEWFGAQRALLATRLSPASVQV